MPGHFPKDEHGLARFDGTALYEHADPRQGEHQDWGTLIFNYGRNEVRNFLLSNALFWLRGVSHRRPARGRRRVDALPRLLAPAKGSGFPNRYGGRENLEAIGFLQQLNTLTHGEQPGTITAAEESTAWPGVSRPVHLGGLGFTYKWNMGWMHDMLRVRRHRIPVHRRWEHNLITFSGLYMFTENFILPFSHDEVVHGKGAMLDKMPGDVWQKHATLRALYGFMYAHPGKKLLFMGSEFGQWREWNHDRSLDWHLLDDPPHAGAAALRAGAQLAVSARSRRCTSRTSIRPGFRWIDCNDNENSVISLVRYARGHARVRRSPSSTSRRCRGPTTGSASREPGYYAELLNSDSADLRRQQRRQRRRRPQRAGRGARLRPVAPPDAAAARVPVSQEARVGTPRKHENNEPRKRENTKKTRGKQFQRRAIGSRPLFAITSFPRGDVKKFDQGPSRIGILRAD